MDRIRHAPIVPMCAAQVSLFANTLVFDQVISSDGLDAEFVSHAFLLLVKLLNNNCNNGRLVENIWNVRVLLFILNFIKQCENALSEGTEGNN